MIYYENISYIFFYIYKPVVFSQQKLETKDSLAIIDILDKQQKDWNREDIDEFMKGYLKSKTCFFRIKWANLADGKQPRLQENLFR